MKITNARGTHVYELFAGSKKIGICVARSLDEAVLFATNATTRKTSSKMATSCDYEEISASLFCDGENEIDTIKTEHSSPSTFKYIALVKVGLDKFVSWAVQFGRAVNPMEVSTVGSSLRVNRRDKQFVLDKRCVDAPRLDSSSRLMTASRSG